MDAPPLYGVFLLNLKSQTFNIVKETNRAHFNEGKLGPAGAVNFNPSQERPMFKKSTNQQLIIDTDRNMNLEDEGMDDDHNRKGYFAYPNERETTQENPFNIFEKKYPVDSIIEGEIVNKNEYSLFVKVENLDVDAFLHCNDLTYLNNGEEELTKYKKGDKIKVKVLEIKEDQQKVRVGLKQTQKDPFDYFKDKKINDTITVKIISSDNKGLVVQPEGCEMNVLIKKSQIAVNASDARPSRFVGGERIDSAIAELNLEKRKVSLSIKLLEEIQKKEALDKYGAEGSGKNLPFSTLSDKLKKKDKEKK